MEPVVVTHGGAGVAGIHSDGCVAASRAGLRALEGGASALDAAVAAVNVLEDDVRFNAGFGAAVRLDGVTIHLDAAVADARGFGSVAGVHSLRHPVDLARAVRFSPHVMLVGDGAQALARRLGMVEEDLSTPQKRAAVKDVWARLAEDPRWRGVPVAPLWNFDAPMPEHVPGRTGDTVGAVVRDAHGNVAAAASTGGTSYALRGRVGDTPIFGAGIYCSDVAAVVATGLGEEIWRRLSSREVHDAVARGVPVMEACRRHTESFAPEWDVGVLCVSPGGWGAASNRPMAWASVAPQGVLGSGLPG